MGDTVKIVMTMTLLLTLRNWVAYFSMVLRNPKRSCSLSMMDRPVTLKEGEGERNEWS